MSRLFALSILITTSIIFTYAQNKSTTDSLNSLSKSYLQTDIDASYSLAKEALISAKKNQLPDQVVHAYINLSNIYLLQKHNSNALDSLYSAIPYINSIPTNLANTLLSHIGKTHYALQNDTVSFKKAYFDLNDKKSIIRSCVLLFSLIDYYVTNQNFKKAAESVQRATVLAQKSEDINLEVTTLQKKGIVQFHLNYYDRALSSFEKTSKYFKETEQSSLYAEALRYIAEIQFNKANYSKSTKLFRQSLKIDSGNHIRVLTILAKLNQVDNNHREAITYLRKALNFNKKNKPIDQTVILYLLAGSHFMLKELEKSKLLYDSAITYAKEYRNFHLLGKALSGKSKCYSEENDFKKAAFYLKNAYLAAEQSFEQRIEESYAKENAYYNNIYHSAQIKDLRKDQYIQELELSHSKNQNLILWVILAGISIGLILIIWLYIQNKRFNQQLKVKNTIIDNNNKELQNINNALSGSQLNLLNANKVKDKMFSIITHDVKGALSSIRAQLESFTARTDESKQLIDKITIGKNLINNTIHLINHHIAWAVKQTSDIKVDKVDFLLDTVISKNIELYEAIIETKNIIIKKNIESNLVIHTDFKMINLIFRNLLSNAIKHSPLNSTVRISTICINGAISLSIEDFGDGIPEDKIGTIFNMNQVHNEISHPNSGGSGLYLSYRFAKSMGGQLWVENKKSSGCIFHLEIPN